MDIAKRLKEMKTAKYATCCICGKEFETNSYFWGNNPEPVMKQVENDKFNVCCNHCNNTVVIKARIDGLNGW